MMHINIKERVVVQFAILLQVILVLILFSSKHIFFRDYAIIYEGAYRLMLGQVPYNDFGLPIGPVSLILPAVFFKLFTPSIFVLQSCQIFENFLILIFFSLILIKISGSIKEIIFSQILLSFFFLIFIISPWYNTTALLCSLVAVYLSLSGGFVYSIISGLFCAFSLFSKQDYGGLCFIMITALSVLTNDNKSNIVFYRPISIFDVLKRLFSKTYLIFILGFLLASTSIILSFNHDSFFYWFNYGQFPHSHSHRPINIIDFIISAKLLVFLICFYFSFKYKNVYLLISGAFILMSHVVQFTSGLFFTSFFFFAFYPGILIRVFDFNIVNNWVIHIDIIKLFKDSTTSIKDVFESFLKIILFMAIIFSSVAPIKVLKSHVKSILFQRVENYSFDSNDIKDSAKIVNSQLSKFKYIYLPIETEASIIEIRKYVTEHFTDSNKVSILNISELTPLYAEVNAIPPLNAPLWYDPKVSFFEKQLHEINDRIDNSEFDIILLQAAHNQLPSELIEHVQNSKHYKETRFSGFISPASVLKICGLNENCDKKIIFVFYKI